MVGKIKRIIRYDPAREEELRSEMERDGGVDKRDVSAMILSAYLTVIPVITLVFLAFALIAYLFVN